MVAAKHLRFEVVTTCEGGISSMALMIVRAFWMFFHGQRNTCRIACFETVTMALSEFFYDMPFMLFIFFSFRALTF